MEELFAAVKYADTELHNRIKKEADKKEEVFVATDSSTTIGTTSLDDLQQTTVL